MQLITLNKNDLGTTSHSLRGAILTIGNFDGIHLGHRQLISTVVQCAREKDKASVLYTFSPHPTQFLFPEKRHKLLSSVEKTREVLSTTGLDYLIVKPFTSAFSKLSPEQFIEKDIVKFIQPSLIIVGYNFRFGVGHSGTTRMLKQLGKRYGFNLRVVPPVEKKGITVSSSVIKKAILSGKWDLVPALLGRSFSIRGLVVKGEGRGRKLGFPTINLSVDKDILLPMNGVYTAKIVKKDQCFYSVVNIGTNPTFSDNCLKKIEVHLIEVNKKWTDKKCEVEILKYIRPEKKFPSSKDLIRQIKWDVCLAKKFFGLSS